MPRRINESAFFEDRNLGKKDLLKQKKSYHKDDMKEAKRLYRILMSLFPSMHSHQERTPRPFYSSSSKVREQLCIVKLRKGFNKATHMRFLEEYLPQNNKDDVKEKPSLFSSDEVNDNFIETYKQNMTSLHYKFIISPENPNVDCEALVKTLIKRMEQTTGYNFSWVGAVHTNTNHPHAHLLINGKDKNGKTVNMNNVFLTRTIREMSRQICTQMVGQRTKDEIEASIKRIPYSNRYTVIDKQIENKMYSIPNDDVYGFTVVPNDNVMLERLIHLESLGFAKRENTENRKFYLEKNWNEKLKNVGRYNSFLQARQELLFTASGELELFAKGHEQISGKITKLYKMNYEESWDNAVVVENKELKKAWFIPMYNEPSDKLLNADVNVSTKTEAGKPSKIHIDVTNWGIDKNI